MKGKLKVGVVCSTAGSAILAALDIFNSIHPDSIELVIATDRKCDIEIECKKRKITCQRFPLPDNQDFTKEATVYFKNQSDLSLVLLFYSRLVTSTLHSQIPTLNIHPSLLPVFPGMHAVQQAYEAEAKHLGASLHIVDETMDAGPLIAQTVHPLEEIKSLKAANRLAFSQKVYLTIQLLDMLYTKSIRFTQKDSSRFSYEFLGEQLPSKTAKPAITNKELITAFNDYLVQQDLAEYFI